MKKILLISIVLFLLPCFLIFGFGLLSPFPGRYENDAFDEKSTGIVDVILRNLNDASQPVQYWTIGPGKTRKQIAPFESSPIQVYRMTSHYSVDVENGEIVNRLTDMHMVDAIGNDVKITPAFQRIMELAAEIDHDILKLYILKQGDHLFAVTELNVNLWYPCVLYYYVAENDALIELATFDAQETIGLRMRNPENINA